MQPYPSPRTVCCLLPAQAVQTPWGRSIIIVVDVFRGIEGGEIPFEPMCQALVTIAADRSDDNALRTKPILSRGKQVIHRKHQTSFSSSRSFGAHINSMAWFVWAPWSSLCLLGAISMRWLLFTFYVFRVTCLFWRLSHNISWQRRKDRYGLQYSRWSWHICETYHTGIPYQKSWCMLSSATEWSVKLTETNRTSPPDALVHA